MPGQTTHSGEGILIAVCYRANITVYPTMDYMVTLDDAYVHVQLPMYISNVNEIEMSCQTAGHTALAIRMRK